MADKPTNHREPTQADDQGQPLREELRREHQLVRSTGTISKPVMALAFGVVFLLVAAWFGPKGFASVVYGLLILNSDLSNGRRLFHLIACVAGLSIILHSSTDVAIARWFGRRQPAAEPSLHDKPSASSESETLEKLDEP